MSGRRLRRLLPQPARLRLWLLRQWFTRESFLLRRAQPSRWRRLRARIVLRRRSARAVSGPSGVDRLSAVMVINLAARTDRLTAFAQEMEKLGIEDAQRFDAVSDENAALGCSLSHVGCIQQMVECGWQSVMVCEDDVGFRVSRRELDVLVDQFLDDADADVACLAYFVRRSRPHNALYLRGTVIQTAACYLVKRRVAEELIDIWLAGIEQLRRGGSRNRYILDKAWVPLQSKRVFLVPVVRAAGQRESYSDLQGRVVSYSH